MPDKHHNSLNGAQILVETLESSGVEVCFANPGTSEMHFVAALDKSRKLRSVLCLAETVVTGAADGYARMSNKPGVTLLHTGPGLANGISNLHNAKKALTPVVNIVGEHATYHIKHDAPLTADISTIAEPVSHWVGTCEEGDNIEDLTREALHQATSHPGHISTLILPANTAWSAPQSDSRTAGNDDCCQQVTRQQAPAAGDQQIEAVAQILESGEPAIMILTGNALSEAGLAAASQLQQHCGVAFRAQTSNGRMPRGAGRVYIEPVPYRVEDAIACLQPYKHIIRVCAKAPVAFFAYPDKPSTLYPDSAAVTTLAQENEDGLTALQQLVSRLGANAHEPKLEPRLAPANLPKSEEPLTAEGIGLMLAADLPHDAIVVDEAISNGARLPYTTRGAEAHDWLQICGGSIGAGFPLATGAAIACPTRRVVALQADGSGMYSLQALWTQAREELDITTLVLSNRAYAILKYEFRNVGADRQMSGEEGDNAEPSDGGQTARDLMDLDRPTLDWVALANGMGVSAERVSTFGQLRQAFAASLSRSGPHLIELMI